MSEILRPAQDNNAEGIDTRKITEECAAVYAAIIEASANLASGLQLSEPTPTNSASTAAFLISRG